MKVEIRHWTPEQDDILRRAWADGLSASTIGRRLGLTKNSICGRVHRLKLPSHKRPSVGRKPRPPRPKKMVVQSKSSVSKPKLAMLLKALPKRDAKGHFISAKTVAEKLPPGGRRPIEEMVKPAEGRFTILDLDSHTCRWPFGDRPPFLYCGKPPFEELVYCEEHSRIAFNGKAPKIGRISVGSRF